MLKRREVFFIFVVLGVLLIAIAGLSVFGASIDSATYKEMIDGRGDVKNGTEEIAFQLLVWVNHYVFGSNYDTFFLMFAALGVSFKLTAIFKYSRIPLLSLALYISSYFLLHEYVQIRAGVATGMFLLAMPDLAKGNFSRYLIKALLAISFHWSSIIMLPLYFLIRRINANVFYFLPFVGMILFAEGINIGSSLNEFVNYAEFMSNYYALHAGPEQDINAFNLITISYIVLYFLMLTLFWFRKNLENELDSSTFKIFSLSLFLFFLLSSLKLPVIAFRLSEFLNVVLILLVPSLVSQFKQKLSLSIIFIIYFMFYGWHLIFNVEIIPSLLKNI